MTKKIAGRWKEIALGLLGLALLAYMVHRVGWSRIQIQLAQFGAGPAAFLVAFYCLAQSCFTAAWYVLLPRDRKPVTFWEIFLIYTAGDAVNMTVPSGNLAGEPVKVLLLRDKVPVEAAVSSVTVYKFSDIASMTVFLATGWILHFFFFPLPVLWNIGSAVIIGGMAGLCVLLYVLQRKGIYGPAGRWLHRLGADWVVHKLESAHLVDQGIRTFYENHGWRFVQSLFFNLLAWFGGVAEIMLFMKFSGLDASFTAAFTIETFTLLVNNLIFFIPARLGVGEGSRILLFQALGYGAAPGLSYGLLRRLRELSWIGFGYALLIFSKKSFNSAAPSSASAPDVAS